MTKNHLPGRPRCAVGALAAAALWALASAAAGAEVPAGSGYTGADSCRPCHEAEFAAWRGSHHDLAMQAATPATVLGDFADAKLKVHDVESTFFRRDERFVVRTEGPDGKLADYPVKFTFGVFPLQQYLVEFPGGRLQALPLAWDCRPRAEGGQRWFHLYPGEKIGPDDQLHWTGLYQNWNLQCAACHSTDLRKNYDAATSSYATAYAAINVSCEACHGSGSRHLAWAAAAHPPYAPGDDKGLAPGLTSRWTEAWHLPSAEARTAVRDRPALAAANNVCAPCHARRAVLAEGVTPGSAIEDSSRPAVVASPLYYDDGQQREEDYVWGSFLQSRMFARGVTCMDCHDAHSQKLRAEGNVLCSRCHNAAIFDTRAHTFHEPGSAASHCVECHMPSRNFMVVDARRDHFVRVPRPDVSEEVGSPDACTGCHVGRSQTWAAEAMDKWYGKGWRARVEYGRGLHDGATQGAKALPSLLALARDGLAPAIVRATAATLAQPGMRADLMTKAQPLLKDEDPSVRIATLGLVEPFDPAVRVPAAAPLMADPILGVRIEAARLLADVPDDALSPDQRSARAKALKEYIASQRDDADWPSAATNLGNLYQRQGLSAQAIAEYQRALTLDPLFAGAYVNLADAYRAAGKDAEGEALLRRGLVLLPRAAGLHHALGLLLVRKGDRPAGLAELAQAATLAPDDPHYAYVYAIGLQSTGKLDEALATLAAAAERNPYNLELLGALVSMNLEAGRSAAALPYVRKVSEALPDDAGVKRLLAGLSAAQ